MPEERRAKGWYPAEDGSADELFWDGITWLSRRTKTPRGWTVAAVDSRPRDKRGRARGADNHTGRTVRIPLWLPIIGAIAVLAAIGVLLARAGTTQLTSPLHAHLPSDAALERLVPGGRDVSSTVPRSTKAPVLCGGVAASRLVGARAVNAPMSLGGVSVLEFLFPTDYDARQYVTQGISAGLPRGCATQHAGGADFQPVSYVLGASSIGQASASARYASGVDEGLSTWSLVDVVPEGRRVFVVTLVTINGFGAQTQMNAVLTAMAGRGAPHLFDGSSAHPDVVDGVLRAAPYLENDSFTRSPSRAAYEHCPVVTITPRAPTYNVVLDDELADPVAGGLVVPRASGQGTVTIPWGAKVVMSVHDYNVVAGETQFPCGSRLGDGHYVNLAWIRPR